MQRGREEKLVGMERDSCARPLETCLDSKFEKTLPAERSRRGSLQEAVSRMYVYIRIQNASSEHASTCKSLRGPVLYLSQPSHIALFRPTMVNATSIITSNPKYSIKKYTLALKGSINRKSLFLCWIYSGLHGCLCQIRAHTLSTTLGVRELGLFICPLIYYSKSLTH